MSETVLGAVAAVTASALFSLGLVWQSAEARALGRHHRMWALLRSLVRRPRWIAGGGLMLAGFGFHTGALSLAPLTVVQPALAAGLLDAERFDAGIRDLRRTTEPDGVFLYTFFKGVGRAPVRPAG